MFKKKTKLENQVEKVKNQGEEPSGEPSGEPKPEEPKVEEPKVEEPKVEEPKAEPELKTITLTGDAIPKKYKDEKREVEVVKNNVNVMPTIAEEENKESNNTKEINLDDLIEKKKLILRIWVKKMKLKMILKKLYLTI